ncbi:MAG: hypothetical protein U0166_11175 [Acidobacteriota bacterium]
MLAFARLNLRWNPFGEAGLATRAGLAIVGEDVLGGLASALARDRTAVQILASEGRGKTTYLLALAARAGARYVRAQEETVIAPSPREALCCDEIELLPARVRRRLYARCGSIALSTHADLTRELARAGLAVVTHRVSIGDRDELAAIIDRRISWARRGPGALPRVPEASIAALQARHGDDVRAIEADLYHAFQGLREVGDVEV